MAKEMVFLCLLLSMLVAAVVLACLCGVYRLRLRGLRRRLLLSEARLALYRGRLVVLRGGTESRDSCSAATLRDGARLFASEADDDPNGELRQRLERGPRGSSGIVERYRLVGNMVRRGLSAEDISAILQIPPGETEQLLKLAQVGRAGG